MRAACALLLAAALGGLLAPAARAESVFAGATTRVPSLEGTAKKLAEGLGKAFAAEGAVDLTDEAGVREASPARVEDLTRLLADARGRYLEGDFRAALERTGEALRRFERAFAYEEDAAAWAVYAELMLVRALAQGRLGARDRADRTLAQLAATVPDYVPDPGLAPPNVSSRHAAIREGLAARPASLEVTSRPAGAEILLNGRRSGLTPSELRVLPGRHYVSLRHGSKRWDQRVFVREAKRGLATTLDDPRRAAAEQLVLALARGASEVELSRLAADVENDAHIALVEPAGSELRVLVGRLTQGKLKAVTALVVPADLSDLEDASLLLATTSLAAESDGFAAGSGDAAELRERFLGGRATAGAAGEGGSPVLPALVGAAVVGVVLVAAAAAAGAIAFATRAPNPGGTDLVIDASRL